MKKTLLISLISVITTIIVLLSLLEIKSQRDQLKADKTEVVYSEVLGERRTLLVHLPRGYHTNLRKSYPVLYALDATSHDRDILHAANTLRSAELLTDVIIVGVVNEDRDSDLTPHYTMVDDSEAYMGQGDLFLSFLENEAIPLIDNQYRTTSYKMISGNSRGGLFVFFSLLERPALFDAYFSYSPALWRDEIEIANKAKSIFHEHDQFTGFLYLSIGAEENDKMKNGFNKVIKIIDQRDSLSATIHYNYTQGADHGINSFYSIPMALRRWNEDQLNPE